MGRVRVVQGGSFIWIQKTQIKSTDYCPPGLHKEPGSEVGYLLELGEKIARRVNLPTDNLPSRSKFSQWATLRQSVG